MSNSTSAISYFILCYRIIIIIRLCFLVCLQQYFQTVKQVSLCYWGAKKINNDAVVDLYKQYVHDLGNVLDRHAPLISRLTNKDSTDWIFDGYQRAKSLRHQFERTWRRAKNPLNRSQLCRLVNKDKSDYYSKLISDNS